MVSDITLQKWRNQFEAMTDEELRLLSVSGRVRERRLDILRLVIHERDRTAAGLDRSEELNIAREANRLAAEANDKATTANTIATMAIIIAIIAVAVSIITAFLKNGA